MNVHAQKHDPLLQLVMEVSWTGDISPISVILQIYFI